MKTLTSLSPRVYANAKFLFSLLGFFVAITSVFYVGVYLVSGVWQALFAAGVLGGVIFLVPISYNLFRRGYRRVVFTILIAGLLIGYGVNELVWEGLLPYHLIGGIILLYLICNLLLPRSYGIWIIFLAVYLAFLALVNLWPPLPRVDHSELPILLLYAIMTNLLLVSVFGGITVYYAFGKRLRARMMILFTLLVGIPLLISGSITAFQSAYISQSQAITRLENNVTLRQVEIQDWLDSIKSNLERARPTPQNSAMVQVLTEQGPESEYSKYRSDLVDSVGGLVERSPSILRIYMMNLAGQIIYSTDIALDGLNRANDSTFQQASEGYTALSPVSYNAEALEPSFQMALPILNQDNETVGVLAADIGFADLNEILTAELSGSQTGEVLLFSEQGILLSPSRYGYRVGEAFSLPINLTNAIAARRSETESYTSYRGEGVLGSYAWVQSLGAMLVVEEAFWEARLPMLQTVLTTGGVTLVALLLALAASWFASIRIARPINNLAQTATDIAAGNLNLVVSVEQEDEIGDLGRVFNSMTAQLSAQLAQLEARVAERTEELERRSMQLQVAAEIARDASSTQDFDLLIQQAVDLVRERFGYYHAGLFLLDVVGEYAVLRAATGEIGQQMVVRGHKLKLGEEGMVGYVAARGVSRIALDVGDDAVHFRNPDLPLTRSEMTLPLKVGARVIGVLDVQSEKEKAFNQEDVVILQTMADQLAVAIENARLLNEVQASLHQVEVMYGTYSQQSWTRIMAARELSGFQYERTSGVEPLHTTAESPDVVQRQPALIPLRVRGQEVGKLRVYPSEEGWSDEQLQLLDALGDRVSQAMESARLYEESQQRAANERVVSAITARMRATMDMDTILQTTIREIRQAFDLQEVEIRLGLGGSEPVPHAEAFEPTPLTGQ